MFDDFLIVEECSTTHWHYLLTSGLWLRLGIFASILNFGDIWHLFLHQLCFLFVNFVGLSFEVLLIILLQRIQFSVESFRQDGIYLELKILGIQSIHIFLQVSQNRAQLLDISHKLIFALRPWSYFLLFLRNSFEIKEI